MCVYDKHVIFWILFCIVWWIQCVHEYHSIVQRLSQFMMFVFLSASPVPNFRAPVGGGFCASWNKNGHNEYALAALSPYIPANLAKNISGDLPIYILSISGALTYILHYKLRILFMTVSAKGSLDYHSNMHIIDQLWYFCGNDVPF